MSPQVVECDMNIEWRQWSKNVFALTLAFDQCEGSLTVHEVLVGDADGSQPVTRHRFDHVRDHGFLVGRREGDSVTLGVQNPIAPVTMETHI